MSGASGDTTATPLADKTAYIADGIFYGDGSALVGVKAEATTLGGYLPTDFILATSLTNYWRITSGAVTSQNATGTRGEYRRSTTNAYFHDGSQWVTWSVSTNFSH